MSILTTLESVSIMRLHIVPWAVYSDVASQISLLSALGHVPSCCLSWSRVRRIDGVCR